MRNNLWAVLRKLAVLAVLGCCLALVSASRLTPDVLATDYCGDCDTFAAACTMDCTDTYNECVAQQGLGGSCGSDRDSCNQGCVREYSFCLDSCQLAGSGSWTNPNCGRGRTQCEVDCNTAKHDCVDNGGDTCGDDYETCMDACCS